MNLLITGAWRQAREYIPEIERKHAVRYLGQEQEMLPCSPEWVEGIIGNGIFLYHDIGSFTNLRYVQLTSAGFDRVPMEYAEKKGIKVNNARGVYSIPMAEYALSGVLSIYKKQDFFLLNQKAKKWEKERELRELYGKTVCVFGCGSVGKECAVRFKAMGCAVYGIDPVVKMQDGFCRIGPLDETYTMLAEADIVILSLPLTEKTKGMFGADALAAMKDGAVLVNIARGALVDTDVLVSELKSGRISAVLDVFDVEPLPPDSELWDMKNVTITPHNSFVGDGNEARLGKLIMQNLEDNERRPGLDP